MTRFNIQWTAKTLTNQMNKGKVNFDNAVQRSLVWDNSKKSLLIHSMLYGFAIPAMYFTRDENGVYDSLDGKQRSNAISGFLSGEYALDTNIPDVTDDEGNVENFGDMTFEQLPEWAQDRIKDYNLTIYYYEDMTEDEIREFFRRLNNGKPLSSIELTRVNTMSLKAFQELAGHDAIQTVVTEAGKKRFTDEMIAMQLYHIATVENPDFSTKSFREWAHDVQIDSEVMSRLDAGLDAYKEFLDSLDSKDDKQLIKTVKARTHFISAVYYCYLAVEAEKSQDEINNILVDFFSGNPSTSDDYNKTVTSGSAKPASVQMRRDVMKSLVGEETNRENGTYDCESCTNNGTCDRQDENEDERAEEKADDGSFESDGCKHECDTCEFNGNCVKQLF